MVRYKNVVSDICLTRSTSYRTSWQTRKKYLVLRPDLVYRFKCSICSDIHGKTKKKETRKKVKSPKESALFDYFVHTGHNARFDDFETLVKKCDINSDSDSESHFWYCMMIHLWIEMLSPSLWTFSHNYLQFSFII